MTLARYALTVAGPRDFLINLVINTIVPWWVLRGMDATPLVGNPSALTLLAPMCFLLFSVNTFFGFHNGVRHRRAGRAQLPVEPATRWLPLALRIALVYGATALVAATALILTLAWRFPDARLPSPSYIVLQGTLAACLAYAVQVNGVLQTRRL